MDRALGDDFDEGKAFLLNRFFNRSGQLPGVMRRPPSHEGGSRAMTSSEMFERILEGPVGSVAVFNPWAGRGGLPPVIP